nr:hypothetical protein [Bacillus wiedmannii]
MSYIEFKPTLKKVNLKPGGKKEIVLEVVEQPKAEEKQMEDSAEEYKMSLARLC